MSDQTAVYTPGRIESILRAAEAYADKHRDEEGVTNREGGMLLQLVSVVTELQERVHELGPDELLVRIPLHIEHDSGNWEGSEPPYDCATAGDFEILADTLSDDIAGMAVHATEQAELFPDGLHSLNTQIVERFAAQRDALEQRARDREAGGFAVLSGVFDDHRA